MKSQFLLLLLLHITAQFAQTAPDCAGADLSRLASAVYVSPGGNDSNACGQDISSPCKTIQQGIKNCRGENCGVLVRYGVYNLAAPLDMADGVSLYGSCAFEETAYKYRTMIVGRPAIRAERINKQTSIYGLVVLGSSTTSSGEASFAITISNSQGITLNRDVLASGRGANGGNGNSSNGPSGGYGASASGETGGAGGKACLSSPPPGLTGQGGQGAAYQQLRTSGCFSGCSCENNNYPASLGKQGESSGIISGGIGGDRGSAGCRCSGAKSGSGDGPVGANGLPGACSSAGGGPNSNNKGSFNGVAWVPSRGDGGSTGQVGSGGGGGGSGGYGVFHSFSSPTDYPGKPGGGGGGGGCGGPGGQGGQQGGASIPIVLFNSSLLVNNKGISLVPGPGGRGGNGGAGGKGGTGGGGGSGVYGHQIKITSAGCDGTVPGTGGKGGTGGRGGSGSGGAGGNGGPSFGIAQVNSRLLLSVEGSAGPFAYPAQPGAGGSQGAGGQNEASQCKGADGRAGLPGFFDNNNSFVSYTATFRVDGSENEN